MWGLSRTVRWKTVEFTKRDHVCQLCGQVIPSGERAKVSSMRRYVHYDMCKRQEAKNASG